MIWRLCCLRSKSNSTESIISQSLNSTRPSWKTPRTSWSPPLSTTRSWTKSVPNRTVQPWTGYQVLTTICNSRINWESIGIRISKISSNCQWRRTMTTEIRKPLTQCRISTPSTISNASRSLCFPKRMISLTPEIYITVPLMLL